MTMQLSYNSATSAETVTMQSAAAGTAMPTDSHTTIATPVMQTESPEAMQAIDWGDFTSVFLAAGVVINLVMITAYVIWAYKQLNREKAGDE